MIYCRPAHCSSSANWQEAVASCREALLLFSTLVRGAAARSLPNAGLRADMRRAARTRPASFFLRATACVRLGNGLANLSCVTPSYLKDRS